MQRTVRNEPRKSVRLQARDLHRACPTGFRNQREPVTAICFLLFFFFFLKWFYPYITIICEDSSFLFLVQILGNKHGSWWRELSTEDPGLWAGWRDHIRPGAASWGWMEVSECGLFWGKKEWNGCLVTRKIGCGVDCSMFANYFPFLPRHPALAFPVFLRGKQNHVTVS